MATDVEARTIEEKPTQKTGIKIRLPRRSEFIATLLVSAGVLALSSLAAYTEDQKIIALAESNYPSSVTKEQIELSQAVLGAWKKSVSLNLESNLPSRVIELSSQPIITESEQIMKAVKKVGSEREPFVESLKRERGYGNTLSWKNGVYDYIDLFQLLGAIGITIGGIGAFFPTTKSKK